MHICTLCKESKETCRFIKNSVVNKMNEFYAALVAICIIFPCCCVSSIRLMLNEKIKWQISLAFEITNNFLSFACTVFILATIYVLRGRLSPYINEWWLVSIHWNNINYFLEKSVVMISNGHSTPRLQRVIQTIRSTNKQTTEQYTKLNSLAVYIFSMR